MLLNLANTIISCYKEIDTLISNTLIKKDISLNLSQIVILLNIKETGIPICDRISRGAIQHNLNKLMSMDLIKKNPKYCSDRRRVRFEVTDKGNELLNQIKKVEKKSIKILIKKIRDKLSDKGALFYKLYEGKNA